GLYYVSLRGSISFAACRELAPDIDFESRVLVDIRTITKHLQLDPKIDEYVCCRRCYSLYDIESAPPEASVQRIQKTPAPKPHLTNLANIFFTQPFNNWLEWFLSLPQFESQISESPPETLSDIFIVDYHHQSKAQKKMYPQSQTTPPLATSNNLQLAFTLFVDWYNPLGNKLSGKQRSMGVLALTCLNLPPSPDMVTISNILRPLVENLLELNNGIRIRTHQFPKGQKVSVRLAVLIGDVVATRKIGGFSLHSGKYFFSWLSLTTQDKIDNGVQWSEFNCLPYWDPVTSRLALCTTGMKVYYNTAFDFAGTLMIKNRLNKQLLKWLSEVFFPTGVTKFPQGFGSAKNGKVKASEWHNLFAIYLPLTFVDLVFDLTDEEELFTNHRDLIANTCALVHCTNVVSSKQVCEDDCKLFEKKYKLYSETSRTCFPHIKILPNHHFALHIPDQLRWWGPITGLSESPGERLIGVLQKFKTNSSNKNNGTVMKKFCQIQRLIAEQGRKQEADYDKVLAICRKRRPGLQLRDDFSNTFDDKVLSLYATSESSFVCKDGKKVSRKNPNNIVEYIWEGKKVYGEVVDIMKMGSGWGPNWVLCRSPKDHWCSLPRRT
ncbi:hypothetical protein VP01_4659g1, partial [Puccinia sorghi]